MKIWSRKIYLIMVILSVIACISDSKTEQIDVDKESSKEIKASKGYLQSIAKAHNADKFKQENQVKFNLKFDVGIKNFFDGVVVLKTDGSKVKFTGSDIKKIIEQKTIKSELDKKLFFLIELYTTGFWYDEGSFSKINSESKDFSVANIESGITNNNYTIYCHPLTDIVQYIEYETKIEDSPFDKGTLHFDRYITVNRVPVPLNWIFKSGTDTIAKAKISRISYPKTF